MRLDLYGRPWAVGLYKPFRYHMLRGGRGSGKSIAASECMVYRCSRPGKRRRAVAGREFGNAIDESIREDLVSAIRYLRVESDWEPRFRDFVNKRNGSRIFLRGSSSNIQSARGWRNIDYVYVDEAQYLRDSTWEQLRNSVRGGEARTGGEFFLNINPQDPNLSLIHI